MLSLGFLVRKVTAPSVNKKVRVLPQLREITRKVARWEDDAVLRTVPSSSEARA